MLGYAYIVSHKPFHYYVQQVITKILIINIIQLIIMLVIT